MIQAEFNDEPYEDTDSKDNEITVTDRNDNDLDVHPIKLPRNNE